MSTNNEASQESYEELLESFPPFTDAVDAVDSSCRYTNDRIHTLQVNVGYRCNLACKHCHHSCSPARTEEMSREVMGAVLEAYDTGGFTSLDITGGAPEMNPELDWLLDEGHKRGANMIVRTNMCILLEPEYEHFVQKYADYEVALFGSLPSYSPRNTDKVRGNGVFMRNIEALHKLNDVGYGTELPLTLVYNPAGAQMAPNQDSMERDYHKRLGEDFGVVFTNLVAIANTPIGRFAENLHRKGNLARYVQKLVDAYNPATVPNMMCRDQLSVDWQGKLYDCDFNQAMHLGVTNGKTIFDYAHNVPEKREIAFKNWCYICTAGAGSSCGGSTA